MQYYKTIFILGHGESGQVVFALCLIATKFFAVFILKFLFTGTKGLAATYFEKLK